MPTAIHSFSQQEIMAYFDGELSPQRALAAAQHLEQCRECQRLAEDLQHVSQTLLDWQIEPITSELPRAATTARMDPKLAFWRRPVVLIASAAAVLLLVVTIPTRLSTQKQHSVMADRLERSAPPPQVNDGADMAPSNSRPAPRSVAKEQASSSFVLAPSPAPPPASVPLPPPPSAPSTIPSGPLIVRIAQLSLTSKNFDRSRAEVERIARKHTGYIAHLEFNTPPTAGRSLDVTLRVPAAQLDVTVDNLKRTGHLDEESQSGEDVTQHYVDTNARLANLRTTEGRLLQILRDRTGRLSDVLEVEEAVDRTRGEIETAEAEQKTLSNQIAFATVNLRISEEYKTPLDGNDISVLTRLHNATVQGFKNAIAILLGALALLLSTGPALLLIVTVAFFPARWLWRTWHCSANSIRQ